jgi:hypothetical protein
MTYRTLVARAARETPKTRQAAFEFVVCVGLLVVAPMVALAIEWAPA